MAELFSGEVTGCLVGLDSERMAVPMIRLSWTLSLAADQPQLRRFRIMRK